MTRRPRPAWMRVPSAQRTRVPSVPRSLHGWGRHAWRRTAPVLHHAGILTRLDLIALESLCRCWAHWRECMDLLAARPGTGPLEEAARAWNKVTRDYLADFFLVPRSRATAFDRDPLGEIGRPHKKGA